jgi:ABC-type uncharacterized transport system permease subunit
MSKFFRGLLASGVAGFLLWLYIGARAGDVTSIAILSVLSAVVLILMGVAIALLVIHFISKHRQADFAQNASENIAIMGQIASVQNQQNAMLLRQAQKALPAGDVIDTQAKIVFDEGLFNDLDGANNSFLHPED